MKRKSDICIINEAPLNKRRRLQELLLIYVKNKLLDADLKSEDLKIIENSDCANISDPGTKYNS